MIINKQSKTDASILKDLLTHTRKNGECLEWLGCKNSDGYPRMVFRGNANTKVHRLVVELHLHEDISGKIVQHSCDNPMCINLKHLSLGSLASNNLDRKLKGRSYRTLTREKIDKIRFLLKSGLFKQKDIALAVNCDPRRVSDVKNNLYDLEGNFVGR